MPGLTMGVIGTSFKENEHRAPIHPDHLQKISPELRERMWFEHGYGVRFGMSDEVLGQKVAGLATREELFATTDIVLLPKPTEADFPFFREGQILWGWPHCVQGQAITQLAIDKKLTMIAWEAMHLWKGDQWELHVFHLNNELAGYASVLHALQLKGMTGHYGKALRCCVISFGSTGRGAIHALQGLGYSDITLFTRRPGHTVSSPIPSVKHWQYRRVGDTPRAEVVLDESTMTMARALGHFDVIVNCTFQDTDAPFMYLHDSEIEELRPGTVIIDVSCDEGMAFEFAKPTSFEAPAFEVGGSGRCLYYAVDHTPSYLWNSATQEISTALMPYVETVMAGPDAWHADETIRRSIEIESGRIRNSKILSFQGRSAEWPHLLIS